MTWPNYLAGQRLFVAGVEQSPRRNAWNFIGVTATYNTQTQMWDITVSGGGGGSGHTIQDEGVSLTQRSTLNFVGPNVTVTDVGGKTQVSVPAVNLGGGGVTGVLTVDKGGTGLSALGTALHVVRVNAAGTALEFAAASGGVTDHGALTGLADDDHPQYLLASGARALSGPWDVGNQAIDDVKSISYEGEVDNGNSSTAATIDGTTGALQKSTLTGNCTYTFTAPQPWTAIQLRIVQDATGGRTVTWPGSVVWDKGYAPKMAGGPDTETIISGYYDGTNYRLVNPDRGIRILTESGTTRPLVATDANADITCTNAAGCAVTVPPHSSVPFEGGTVVLFTQGGAGQVTLVAGVGVTLQSSETLKTLKQYAVMGIKKTASNTWTVFGEREIA
jgi:hypothetical protein